MIRLSLLDRKRFDSYVDNAEDKRGLEKLAERKFTTLEEFSHELRKYHSVVSMDWEPVISFIKPVITELPFALKELPVFYYNPKAIYRSNGVYIGNAKSD